MSSRVVKRTRPEDVKAEPPAVVLLGRYVLEEEIGRGGMAAVYRATDTTLERPVAVKVLHAYFCEEPAFVEQFLAVERQVARLSHPHLVTVFDAGHDAGTCFVVMEYVASGSLRRVLDGVEQAAAGDGAARRPRLPLLDSVRTVSDVAAALQYLHEHGIVHGDVKPDNILLDERGRAKLADFGLAQLARASEVTRTVVDGGRDANGAGGEHRTSGQGLAGTAAYLAPEQIEHGRTDARSDLYSLGLVAYELFAGRRPFESEHWVAATTQRLIRDPEPLALVQPEVPSAISEAVMRALARDPQARFATAGEFRAALQQRSAGETRATQTEASDVPTPSLVWKPHDPDETGLLAAPVIPVTLRETPAQASLALSLRQRFLLAWHIVLSWATRVLWQRPIRASRTLREPLHTRLKHFLAWARERMRRVHPWARVAIGLALVMGVFLLVPVFYRIANPPRTVVVADLAGRELAEARKVVEENGVPVRLAAEPSDTVPKGHVVRQDPTGGAPFTSDRSVTLFVSSGPAPVRMPDLRQRRLEDARQDLEAAGLTLGTVSEFETPRQPWGAVLTQGAYPGKLVPPGTAVEVTVSVPARAEVPLLVGQTVGDAEAALEKRGLRLGAVRQEPVPGKRAGTVTAQDPAAGVRLRQGEGISVTIAVPAAG